jgi:hypothetical protein
MVGKELSREQLVAIDRGLPLVLPLQKRAAALDPDLISLVRPQDSKFPSAAACLADAGGTLCEVRYGFSEYHVHRIYYRETMVPPSVIDAVFYERYYLDDVAFRLYGAGEDIAEAIICMLELSDEAVKRYREGVTSKQATLGRYLVAELPEHVLTGHIRRLAKSEAWKKTRDYRDECVHEQPPLVEGQGIVYHRGTRWKKSESGLISVSIGAGDQPRLTTGAIFDFLMPAFEGILTVFEECLSWYEHTLQEPAGVFPSEIAGSEPALPPKWLKPAAIPVEKDTICSADDGNGDHDLASE